MPASSPTTKRHLWQSLPGIDFLIAAVLAVVTIISRLPYMTHYLFAWDSGTVALGTRHFDMLAHEPHPPGYVLYVLTAKILTWFTGDVNASLVWISIIAAAGAVVVLYFLGKEMVDRRVGLVAALILIFGKVFWANSEIAMSYTVLCFAMLLVVLIGYKFIKNPRNVKYLYWGSFALAIIGGFRQDALLFLIPLWLYITLKFGRPYFWKAWGIVVAVCAAWLLGTVFWTSGFGNFFQAFFDQVGYVGSFSVAEHGAGGLRVNYNLFMQFLTDSLKGTSLVIFFAGYLISPKKIKNDPRLITLGLWLLPPILFYIFVHLGERGYLLSFLPALILVLAWGLVWFADEFKAIWSKGGRAVSYIFIIVITGFLMAYNASGFLVGQEFFTVADLAKRDRWMEDKIRRLSETEPGTVYFLERENYKQLHYYFPEHKVFPLPEEIPVDGTPAEDLTTK